MHGTIPLIARRPRDGGSPLAVQATGCFSCVSGSVVSQGAAGVEAGAGKRMAGLRRSRLCAGFHLFYRSRRAQGARPFPELPPCPTPSAFLTSTPAVLPPPPWPPTIPTPETATFGKEGFNLV